MDAVRRVFLWAAAVVVAVATLVMGPAPAWADPPPDVRGLSVDEARPRLVAWHPTVTIQVLPTQLPSGVEGSTVVVSASTWLNPAPTGTTVVRPQVRLTLGTRVPDLTGLTSAEATKALTPRGLRLRSQPAQPPTDWLVAAQQVPAGTIVEFGLGINATFAAPQADPPPLVLVLAAGGGLFLLALLAALALRSRRRSRRRRLAAPAASVEVRGHAGQVVGPDVSELGTSVSIRLESHGDAGTLTVEEVRP